MWTIVFIFRYVVLLKCVSYFILSLVYKNTFPISSSCDSPPLLNEHRGNTAVIWVIYIHKKSPEFRKLGV